jgi:hypothetical protein
MLPRNGWLALITNYSVQLKPFLNANEINRISRYILKKEIAEVQI